MWSYSVLSLSVRWASTRSWVSRYSPDTRHWAPPELSNSNINSSWAPTLSSWRKKHCYRNVLKRLIVITWQLFSAGRRYLSNSTFLSFIIPSVTLFVLGLFCCCFVLFWFWLTLFCLNFFTGGSSMFSFPALMMMSLRTVSSTSSPLLNLSTWARRFSSLIRSPVETSVLQLSFQQVLFAVTYFVAADLDNISSQSDNITCM